MSEPPPQPAPTPPNPFWKAVVVSSFIFCGTTLAIVMTQFGEQRSAVNQFLRKHGDLLAAIEVGVVLVCGVLAMSIDQRQTRTAREQSAPDATPTTGADSDVG